MTPRPRKKPSNPYRVYVTYLPDGRYYIGYSNKTDKLFQKYFGSSVVIKEHSPEELTKDSVLQALDAGRKPRVYKGFSGRRDSYDKLCRRLWIWFPFNWFEFGKVRHLQSYVHHFIETPGVISVLPL